MWAQTWTNIAEISLPFPDKNQPNVGERMKKLVIIINTINDISNL